MQNLLTCQHYPATTARSNLPAKVPAAEKLWQACGVGHGEGLSMVHPSAQKAQCAGRLLLAGAYNPRFIGDTYPVNSVKLCGDYRKPTIASLPPSLRLAFFGIANTEGNANILIGLAVCITCPLCCMYCRWMLMATLGLLISKVSQSAKLDVVSGTL